MRFRPSTCASRCSAFKRGLSTLCFLKYAVVACSTCSTVMIAFAAWSRWHRRFPQTFCHIGGLQTVDQFAEVALHHPVQIVKCQPDTMLCDAVLREIVGANLFFASAG